MKMVQAEIFDESNRIVEASERKVKELEEQLVRQNSG